MLVRRLFILFALSLTFFSILTANERLVISSIDGSSSQMIATQVYVADESWNVYRPQTAAEFSILEGSIPITPLSLNCHSIPSLQPCPIFAMFNTSSLLGANAATAQRLISSLVSALPSDGSTLGIGLFGERPYVLQDFTSDKSSLSKLQLGFNAGSGTSYDNALLQPPAGALSFVQRSSGAKIIILITDSYGKCNVDSIARRALASQTRIICISLGLPLSDDLRKISTATNGFYFENIVNEFRAEEVAHEIYWRLNGIMPCEITWKSHSACIPNRSFFITHLPTGAKNISPKMAAATALPQLKISPSNIDFGCVGASDSIEITLQAIGGNISLYGFSSDNSDFSANTFLSNIILKDGEERKISVVYRPSDSLFTAARLTFLSDVCPSSITLSAGCLGQRLRPNTVKIIAPNGGEGFIAGDTARIVWQGTPDGGVARLEFSSDGGASWNFLTEGEGLSSYDWIVPAYNSQRCLVRVIYFRSLQKQYVFNVFGDAVNSARFSKNGDLSVVASDDKTVRVFSNKNGAELHVFAFPSENNGVKCAEFSPDGATIAAVAGGNLSAFILDANTGVEKNRLEGHSSGIKTCEFSSNGKYLLTGSKDFTVRLWDLRGNIGIASISGHIGEIEAAHFIDITSQKSGSDSIRFFSAAKNDQSVFEYSALYPPGVIDKKQYAMSFGLLTAGYNFKTKLIALAFENGLLRITSDLSQNGLEISVNSTINDVDFNSDGTLLAVACSDNVARIYDAKSGREIRAFKGHSGQVLSVRFSPDGTQLLTASADSTTRLWDVNIGPLQSDTSDGFWQIGVKRLWANNCNFGNVDFGSVRDSTFAAAVCNGGTFPTTIDSIVITSKDAYAFDIAGGFPRNLSPDSCGAIRIRFAPSEEKIYTALCSVYSTGRKMREFTITGAGFRPNLQAVSTIDFGSAETGTFKDSLARVFLRNGYSSTITIDSIKFENSKSGFAVLNSGSATLAPGEIRAMDLRFGPLKPGRRSDRLAINYSDQGLKRTEYSQAAVDVFGEGICSQTTSFALLEAEKSRIETESGKEIQVKIIVRPPSDLPAEKLPVRCEAVFQCNASLLLPVADSVRGVVENNRRIIKATGTREPGNDVFFSLDFYTAFGNEDSTLIEIQDIAWPGCIPFALPKPITVVFTDVCRTGDSPRRFIDKSSKLYLTVTPNPAMNDGNGTIEFGLRENGEIRLYVTDMTGRIVQTISDGLFEAGAYHASENFNRFANGEYLVVLETPTKVLSTPLTIIR